MNFLVLIQGFCYYHVLHAEVYSSLATIIYCCFIKCSCYRHRRCTSFLPYSSIKAPATQSYFFVCSKFLLLCTVSSSVCSYTAMKVDYIVSLFSKTVRMRSRISKLNIFSNHFLYAVCVCFHHSKQFPTIFCLMFFICFLFRLSVLLVLIIFIFPEALNISYFLTTLNHLRSLHYVVSHVHCPPFRIILFSSFFVFFYSSKISFVLFHLHFFPSVINFQIHLHMFSRSVFAKSSFMYCFIFGLQITSSCHNCLLIL